MRTRALGRRRSALPVPPWPVRVSTRSRVSTVAHPVHRNRAARRPGMSRNLEALRALRALQPQSPCETAVVRARDTLRSLMIKVSHVRHSGICGPPKHAQVWRLCGSPSPIAFQSSTTQNSRLTLDPPGNVLFLNHTACPTNRASVIFHFDFFLPEKIHAIPKVQQKAANGTSRNRRAKCQEACSSSEVTMAPRSCGHRRHHRLLWPWRPCNLRCNLQSNVPTAEACIS